MTTKRRTKIVATLGPASSSPEKIEQLILAGMDVARLNFSHGTADDQRERAELVRSIAEKHGKYVAVMGDLQGPTIRHERFKRSEERSVGKEGVSPVNIGVEANN